MFLLTLAYCVLGVGAGVMSGLLGIGGGLVVVPGLAFLFKYSVIPHDLIMKMAVGTSLATMILTSMSALREHLRNDIVFWPIFRRLLPGIIVGTILGAIIAHFLNTRILEILFGIFVLFIALRLLFAHQFTGRHELPRQSVMHFVGLIVGTKSGLLGLGGGALTIPFLAYCNVSIRTAVVVSAATSLTVAIIGTISFMINGLQVMHLPAWSMGYVYWPAGLPIMICSLLFTPLGVRLSHYLPTTTLKKIFGVFLLLIGLQMLF